MRSARDRLREVIEEVLATGETQSALAERLGVTQSTISGWLGDERLDPRASVLGAVAKTLGINGHWLLTEQGDKYTLEPGADAVRASGIASGLALAEQALGLIRAVYVSRGRAKGAGGGAGVPSEVLALVALLESMLAGSGQPKRRKGGGEQ